MPSPPKKRPRPRKRSRVARPRSRGRFSTSSRNRCWPRARPEGQEGGLGEDATIRKAIDAAEPKIAAAFKDQPVVEAAVRDVLGMTYYHLGEPSLAIHQDERQETLRSAARS